MFVQPQVCLAESRRETILAGRYLSHLRCIPQKQDFFDKAGKLIYVNVAPFIHCIEISNEPHLYYDILNEALTIANVTLSKCTPEIEPTTVVVRFEKVMIVGETQICSNSVFLLPYP